MNVKIDEKTTEHLHIFVVPKRNEENSIQSKLNFENEFK